MIFETLDKHIADAMFEEKNSTVKLKTNFWKGVKTEMVNAVHNGVEFPNDEEETKILRSMLKRCRTAAQEFAKAGDDNKVAVENRKVNEFEAAELEKLLPKEPAFEEVYNETVKQVDMFVAEKLGEDENFSVKQLQRFTKDIIAKVKAKYPNANNGVIANVVKEIANK